MKPPVVHTLLAAAGLVLAAEVTAQDLGSVVFSDLYHGDQSLGTSADLFGGALTVTAHTNLNADEAFEFAFAPGPDDRYDPIRGTVYFNDDSDFEKAGLGVKTLSGGGSKGVSGGGGDQNEQLVFTYNTLGARLDTVGVLITELEFGHGLNDKDDPVLWITTQSGHLFVSEDVVAAVAQQIGGSKAYTVDFGDLVGRVTGLAADDVVSSFLVRETEGHIFVNGVTGGTIVPEPSGVLLLGLGSLGLILRRRR